MTKRDNPETPTGGPGSVGPASRIGPRAFRLSTAQDVFRPVPPILTKRRKSKLSDKETFIHPGEFRESSRRPRNRCWNASDERQQAKRHAHAEPWTAPSRPPAPPGPLNPSYRVWERRNSGKIGLDSLCADATPGALPRDLHGHADFRRRRDSAQFPGAGGSSTDIKRSRNSVCKGEPFVASRSGFM